MSEIVAQTTTALTLANSPLLTAWVNAVDFNKVTIFGIFAGGTTTVTLQGSLTGTEAGDTADADYNQTVTFSSGFATMSVGAPYMRLKVAQTSADATKTKIIARTSS